MTEHQTETAMIYFECQTCLCTALCVDTATARLAWHDHMENHVLTSNYRAWTWTVVQLDLG